MVMAWASSWSEQRVNDYFDFYSQDFRPAENLSRSEWQSQRRERILAPRFIEVEITDLDVEPRDGRRARVRFHQTYRSGSFQDVGLKVLELVLEDQQWKISEEWFRALPQTTEPPASAEALGRL